MPLEFIGQVDRQRVPKVMGQRLQHLEQEAPRIATGTQDGIESNSHLLVLYFDEERVFIFATLLVRKRCLSRCALA